MVTQGHPGLTFIVWHVGELLGLAAVATFFAFQLQEDCDGLLDLCGVVLGGLKHNGVLWRREAAMSSPGGLGT